MAIIPKTGISVTLIKQTIGAGVNDVAGLCTHKNINKWAEYKPSKFGYGKFSFSLMRGVNNAQKFDYDRPVGGSISPYRLGDFRGYDHDAKSPSFTLPAQPIVISATAISVDIYYYIPFQVRAAMPGYADSKTYLCLTSNYPYEANGAINELYGAVPMEDSGEFKIKAYFRGLTVVNGQEISKTIKFAIYKRLDINVAVDEKTNYEFQYTIGDVTDDASSLIAQIKFVGKQDILEDLEIEVSLIFEDYVSFVDAYVNILNRTTMDAEIVIVDAKAIASAAIGKSIEVILYPTDGEDPVSAGFFGPLTTTTETFSQRANFKNKSLDSILLTINI